MRTFFTIFALLLILSLGYLAYAHFTGGSVPTLGLPIGGERAKIRARILSFFEHVKFKNASALTDFVQESTTEAEIIHYLVKTIGLDLEDFDLETVIIDEVEIDSSHTRARVMVNLKGKDLSDRKPFTLSKLIFLSKSSDGRWLIDTKSDLTS